MVPPRPSNRSRRQRTLAGVALFASLHASAATFYVDATRGNDTGPGSATAPWRTFYRAAQALRAGDTAIFADGVYPETRRVVIAHSGTPDAPITFRSRNKHGAVIRFQNLQSSWGHLYSRQSYITIEDFDITQDAKGTTPSDVLVYFDNSTGMLKDAATQGNRFLGNKIHDAYFNALKAYKTDDLVVDGNILYDTDGLAFVSTNSFGTIFRNNLIFDVRTRDPHSGTAIQFKGGARSAQIYNNVFRVRSGSMTKVAIVIGGQSKANAVYDSGPQGYEAYNCVAHDNVIVAEDIGSLKFGLLMSGAKNSAFVNNVVVGAQWAIYLERAPGDAANGWAWDPQVVNPVVKNNIVLDSAGSGSHSSAYFGGPGDVQGSVDHDYNLYYNAAKNDTLPPREPHGVYADPMLVDTLNDWHLRPGSPALNAGQAQAFTGFRGERIDLSRDAAWTQRPRSGRWSLGAFHEPVSNRAERDGTTSHATIARHFVRAPDDTRQPIDRAATPPVPAAPAQ